MNVAELIKELQTMPQYKSVKVVLSTVFNSDELGAYELDLNDDDALDADKVLDIGGCILIRSR